MANNLLETLGFYVHPDTTISLILASLVPNSNATSFKLGCIRSLKSLLHGIPGDKLKAHTAQIVNALMEKEMIQNENMHILYELSQCTYELVSKFDPEPDTSFQLFLVLINLQSVPGSEGTPKYIELKEMVWFVLF